MQIRVPRFDSGRGLQLTPIYIKDLPIPFERIQRTERTERTEIVDKIRGTGTTETDIDFCVLTSIIAATWFGGLPTILSTGVISALLQTLAFGCVLTLE